MRNGTDGPQVLGIQRLCALSSAESSIGHASWKIAASRSKTDLQLGHGWQGTSDLACYILHLLEVIHGNPG
jgi:hypothetical protein